MSNKKKTPPKAPSKKPRNPRGSLKDTMAKVKARKKRMEDLY